MRKTFALTLILASAIAVSACSKTEETTNTVVTNENVTESLDANLSDNAIDLSGNAAGLDDSSNATSNAL